MRTLTTLLAMHLVALAAARPAAGEPLRKLVRDMKRQGVKTQTHKGTTTFTIVGKTAEAWDRSVAKRMAKHYVADKDYRAVQIGCVWRGAEDASHWPEAAVRAAWIAETFQRNGVPKWQIAIFVRNDPRAPEGGVMTIALTRRRPYYMRMGDNLVGGLRAVVVSPAELPKGVVATGKAEGAVSGGTKGVVKGFGSTLRRAGTGAVRILTFWAG